jgi:asparagine synthase (glutamine-hydrolysing)
VVWHCERPLLRTAPIPLFLLSKLVSQIGIKVVLTGEASDEFFGGYDIFKEAKIRRFWARQPQSLLRPLLIGKLYPDIFKNPALKKTLPLFFSQNMQDGKDPFYSHRIRWNNSSRIKQFLSKQIKNDLVNYSGLDDFDKLLPKEFGRWDGLGQSQFLEIIVFLSNYLLSSQGDRVAMAHSIEIRLPFLDHRLIEFAGHVPSKWKMLGMSEKHILKKSFKGILPNEIISRVKHPYRAPIHHSLLHTKSGELHRTFLTENQINKTGIFDPIMVSRLTQKLSADLAGEVDGMALSAILSTQILHQKFVEQFSSIPVSEPALSVLIDKRSSSERQH